LPGLRSIKQELRNTHFNYDWLIKALAKFSSSFTLKMSCSLNLFIKRLPKKYWLQKNLSMFAKPQKGFVTGVGILLINIPPMGLAWGIAPLIRIL